MRCRARVVRCRLVSVRHGRVVTFRYRSSPPRTYPPHEAAHPGQDTPAASFFPSPVIADTDPRIPASARHSEVLVSSPNSYHNSLTMLLKNRLFKPGPTPLVPSTQNAMYAYTAHHRTANFTALFTL